VLTFSQNTLIAYESRGVGEPALLLLPDWGMSRRVFAPLVETAAHRRRVVALDWRGHGESGWLAGDVGPGDLADDAEAVMAADGTGVVVLVAHGQAGWTAIELAQRLGERVAGMVLIDWHVLPFQPDHLAQLRDLKDERRWRRTLDRLTADWFAGLKDRRLDRIAGDMRARGHELWVRTAGAIAAGYTGGRSPLQELAAIDPPPVLHLVAGVADDDDLEGLRVFADLYPWYAVERVGRRGHLPMFAAPAVVSASIERFVQDLGPPLRERRPNR
jgi:pimeloyl-ACP methyl ester carboxylesterase